MPYIPQNERKKFELYLDKLKPRVMTKGQLNYVITNLLHAYIDNQGKSYQTLGDAHGVCFDAAAEFYRRVVAKYEDEKIIENGDVGEIEPKPEQKFLTESELEKEFPMKISNPPEPLDTPESGEGDLK